MSTQVITITPALASFATPYTANDVLGALNTLSSVIDYTPDADAIGNPIRPGAITLGSVVITDAAAQSLAIDLFFYSESITPAADNAAHSVSDADNIKCLGSVSIVAGDYATSALNSVATKRGISLVMDLASSSLYCLAVTRGAPTYGSATDLKIKLGFYQE